MGRHRVEDGPDKLEDLPQSLQIADFVIKVEEYTEAGRWDRLKRQAVGVSGTGWASFDCGGLPYLSADLEPLEGFTLITAHLEVVADVSSPQTEISFVEAHRLQPGVRLGDSLALKVAVPSAECQDLVLAEQGLLHWLGDPRRAGQILVRFDDVTIEMVSEQRRLGRIVDGQAVYPAQVRHPSVIRLSIDGFSVVVVSLRLTPRGARADVSLQLPASIVSAETCGRAMLPLRDVSITQDCELYADDPEAAFGPWIVGDTGMIVTGTGYVVDLSSARSPMPRRAAWKGIVLASGTATGTPLVPEDSNTGYLAGDYAFTQATITPAGFHAQLTLSSDHEFSTVYPLGYVILLEGGTLEVVKSRVASGQLGPGHIILPTAAVCAHSPGNRVVATFSQLTVQTDLDLSGEVGFASGTDLAWGELTHVGDEVVAWTLEVTEGILYLPANPVPTFCPDTGSGFLDLSLPASLDAAVAKLESEGAAGVIVTTMRRLKVRSPDRPGGTANPIECEQVCGWLRIGSQGVDGELAIYEAQSLEELGEPARPGYVAGDSFQATLFQDNKQAVLAQFVASAVYDSNLYGTLDIPFPCQIRWLRFYHMKLTSTAHLVGGDVQLPVGGLSLNYWQLQLVPSDGATQVGVVSVRTGRLVFTAARISEPVHFRWPFGLTWGEMRADGNLGELFFDHNSSGQRFDGLPYSPHHIMLSPYVAGTADPYLGTCGTVHINFFGSHFVNIQDARHADPDPPFLGRKVTVPDQGEASCEPTDLHLTRTWHQSAGGDLAVFDFPDAQMAYNETIQQGFIGTGTAHLSFLQSNGLDATIEVHRDALDIRFSSQDTHDLDLGLFARVGGMAEIAGCARIEGPLLSRLSLWGYLETASAGGMAILGPKAGHAVELQVTTTPTSLDVFASGSMLLSVGGSAVDLSATVHLFHDHALLSAEGEVIGRIDCNEILAGLEGEGQLTWYVDPSIQYLQGKLKMEVCGWTGGSGLEGGFFIGHDAPRSKAWVLTTGTEHFGVSSEILPDTLAGLYGYGQVSFSVQWYVFGGGVSLYAGMGAFSQIPPGLQSVFPPDWSAIPGLGLPYVIGSCGIHVHGEILGGLVSASAWADLDLVGPVPLYFEGSFGLEGCVVWVICGSVEVTAGLSSSGFYLY